MKTIPVKKHIASSLKDRLILGDSIQVLKKLPNNSIDHCITDPPYNISGYDNKKKIGWLTSNSYWSDKKNFSKIDANWDKFPDETYEEFIREWLRELKRVVKPNGNIIIFGSYHNIYSIGYLLKKIDRRIINSIVWYKRNAFPNVTQRMLCESTEHIIWAVNETQKNAKNWVFNYKDLKDINNGLQMRNMWDILSTPISEKKHGKHPSQKPLELIKRLVLGSSKPGDLILDPFVGSGTLPVAAKILKRCFIGIDNDPEYLKIASKRLRDL